MLQTCLAASLSAVSFTQNLPVLARRLFNHVGESIELVRYGSAYYSGRYISDPVRLIV